MADGEGPIRSKYRGLSWDKKYQGWRVRVYYAGKQRHVGRYEDEVSAARAYDKAVVCLYGNNAITNFGLNACLADPTEVSSFIIQAKEQAEQEQQGRTQHKLFSIGASLSPVQLQAVMYNGRIATPHLLACSTGVQQQSRLSVIPVDKALTQPCIFADDSLAAYIKDSLQTQYNISHSQALGIQHPIGLDTPYVLVSPLPDTVTANKPLTTGDLVSSNVGTHTASSSAGNLVLCSTACGPTMMPLIAASVPSVSCCSVPNGADFNPGQQIMQHHLQQLQQPHLLSLIPNEPLQMQVTPGLVGTAGQMKPMTANAAGQQQYLHLQQQLQGLTVLDSLPQYSSPEQQQQHQFLQMYCSSQAALASMAPATSTGVPGSGAPGTTLGSNTVSNNLFGSFVGCASTTSTALSASAAANSCSSMLQGQTNQLAPLFGTSNAAYSFPSSLGSCSALLTADVQAVSSGAGRGPVVTGSKAGNHLFPHTHTFSCAHSKLACSPAHSNSNSSTGSSHTAQHLGVPICGQSTVMY